MESSPESPRDGSCYTIAQNYPPPIPTSISVRLISIENLASTMPLTKDFHLQYLRGSSHYLGKVKQLSKLPRLLRGQAELPHFYFQSYNFPHNSRLLPINTYPG